MMLSRSLIHALLLAALGAAPAAAGPSPAARPMRTAAGPTFVVTSLEDAPAGGDFTDDVCQTAPTNFTCTLRAAIMEANHTPNGPASIIVPAGVYVLTIPPSGSNGETVGDLDLNADMVIEGAGAARTILDGGGLDRVLFTAVDASIAISDLTIRNGSVSSGTGGGIRNSSQLFLYGVAVRNNYSSSGGGGIASYDYLSLNESLVSHNRSNGEGGGVYLTGIMEAQNSTFSNNAAKNSGGGIHRYSTGSLYLAYSTVSGNLADSDSDSSGTGGGIYSAAGQVALVGTMLAENLVGPAHNECAGGPVELLGYNLVQTTQGCTLSVLGSDNKLDAEPLLLPLQDNSGPTLTRALLAGSEALDVGFNTCTGFHGIVGWDQRLFSRPAGSACDIGAYEGRVPAPLIGRNLIRNGDAEAAAGSPTGHTAGVPQWNLSSGDDPTVLPYDIPGGYPLSTDSGPADRGHNFFAGGLAADAYLMQTFDVTPLAAAINAGTLRYEFAGYLGGYADQEDNATLYLTFRDGIGAVTGSTQLGPVTAADRGGVTSLLRQQASGFVPPGTETIDVELRLTSVASLYNDAYADNLSLVLGLNLFLPLLLR